MSKHILMVFTNPRQGCEEDFNSWYDTVHLPDVLQVAGFEAAQRFVARAGMSDALDGQGIVTYAFSAVAERQEIVSVEAAGAESI